MADAVDPRFDPQFQRGFDPEVHKARPVKRAVVETPVVEAPAVELVETGESSETRVVSTGSTTEPDVADEPPARQIPYRLILLLASFAAIAGAAVLLWQRLTADPLDAYYGSNPGILFREQFIDALLIPLLVAGLTGIIIWLALGALRRRDHA